MALRRSVFPGSKRTKERGKLLGTKNKKAQKDEESDDSDEEFVPTLGLGFQTKMRLPFKPEDVFYELCDADNSLGMDPLIAKIIMIRPGFRRRQPVCASEPTRSPKTSHACVRVAYFIVDAGPGWFVAYLPRVPYCAGLYRTHATHEFRADNGLEPAWTYAARALRLGGHAEGQARRVADDLCDDTLRAARSEGTRICGDQCVP